MSEPRTTTLEEERHQQSIMKHRRRPVVLGILLMLVLSSTPIQASSHDEVSLTISTHWMIDGNGKLLNAYMLTFADNGTYVFDTTINHERNETSLDVATSVEWGFDDGHRTALLELNTTLVWADELSVSVTVTDHNGESLPSPITVERSFMVGTWNQPMADHEVMMSTSWSLDQSYANEEGDQFFMLEFDGQGWQQRIGDTLESWELGNGTFRQIENAGATETDLSLTLTKLWKNETLVAGILTDQLFDARGHGLLNLTTNEDGLITVIQANVSQAMLNRSMSGDHIEERLSLEATGMLNLSDQEEENSTLNIDGELSVFFLEYHDVDGVRVFQHSQFEAMADFVLIEDGTRLDVSLDGFSSLERWEDGVRVEQLEELYGSGTFGFEDQDDNASLQINGSILDLHTKVVNGSTMIDDLHVDGVMTGDVQGTFGVLRGIEITGEQANATGEIFLVNVIHQDSWFNITGVNGGNFFDGAGVGATHNETWEYQTVNADWDNRTVRLVWRETTAGDQSEGDELPERSPIQSNATAPEAEDSLGDLTVGRETGLMPIPMESMDSMVLNGQEGLQLTVVAGDVSIEPRDGHNFTVIEWVGTYGDSSGNAIGSIVVEGPLMGLVSSVERSFSIPYGDSDEVAEFMETQLLERVISPDIVTADENSPPTVVSLSIKEGLVIGESGSTAHLIAHVEDSEWNVESVLVDLSPLGGGILALNDRGLDGDSTIGDDDYTASFFVPGLEVGLIQINLTASDSFGAITTASSDVEVLNYAPRLTRVEIAPSTLMRGQSLVINAEAYDGHGVASMQLDLREYGSLLYDLEQSEGTWAGMFAMPDGMTPGIQSLLLISTDDRGATSQHRVWTPVDGVVGHPVFGPHYADTSSIIPIEVTILNDRPTVMAPNLNIEKDGISQVSYSVQVNDPDGLERVQIDMGVYSAIGETSWVMMHDDGINGGDQVAGDGNFTAMLSIRTGTPIGNHEVQIRALDIFGELNTSSAVVTLAVPTTDSGSTSGLSNAVLTVLGGGVLLAAGIVLFFMARGRDGEDGEDDRFGMQ